MEFKLNQMSIRTLSSVVLLALLTLNDSSVVAQEIEKTNGKDWNIPKSPIWNELIKESIPEWMIDAKFECTRIGNLFCTSTWWTRLCKGVVFPNGG